MGTQTHSSFRLLSDNPFFLFSMGVPQKSLNDLTSEYDNVMKQCQEAEDAKQFDKLKGLQQSAEDTKKLMNAAQTEQEKSDLVAAGCKDKPVNLNLEWGSLFNKGVYSVVIAEQKFWTVHTITPTKIGCKDRNNNNLFIHANNKKFATNKIHGTEIKIPVTSLSYQGDLPNW